MKFKDGDIVILNREIYENTWLMDENELYLFYLSFEIIKHNYEFNSCLLRVINENAIPDDKTIMSRPNDDHLFTKNDLKGFDINKLIIYHEDWLILDKKYYRNKKIDELCP